MGKKSVKISVLLASRKGSQVTVMWRPIVCGKRFPGTNASASRLSGNVDGKCRTQSIRRLPHPLFRTPDTRATLYWLTTGDFRVGKQESRPCVAAAVDSLRTAPNPSRSLLSSKPLRKNTSTATPAASSPSPWGRNLRYKSLSPSSKPASACRSPKDGRITMRISAAKRPTSRAKFEWAATSQTSKST